MARACQSPTKQSAAMFPSTVSVKFSVDRARTEIGNMAMGHLSWVFLVSGKLAVSGFWFLVSGFWFLVSGFWLLASGFWLLVFVSVSVVFFDVNVRAAF
jgi:hypothetical protein